MRFSIIVPVYNLESLLLSCAESILNQTFKDFELILIDDGSSDNSPLVCDRLKKEDKRVVVIHKDNGGLSKARNSAIDIARGEYLIFVDGDDRLSTTEALYLIDKRIIEYNEDLILYRFSKYSHFKEHIIRKEYDLDIINKHNKSITLKWLIDNNCMPYATWISCIRKSVVWDKYLHFKKGVVGEDFDWALQTLNAAESIGALNDILYTYVERDGSLSSFSSVQSIKGLSYAISHWLNTRNRSCELDPYLVKIYYIELLNYHNLDASDRSKVKNVLIEDSKILYRQRLSIVYWAVWAIGPYLCGKIFVSVYKLRNFIIGR